MSFRLWAPHAEAAWLEIRAGVPVPTPPPGNKPPPATSPHASGEQAPDPFASLPPSPASDLASLPLAREPGGDTWAARLPAASLPQGAAYRVGLTAPGGRQLRRRDAWARQTDYGSAWAFAPPDRAAFPWSAPRPELSGAEPFDRCSIYEMHVGSFTAEGTFAAAAARLPHVAALGFTAVQLLPLAEHSDAWGYNPRQVRLRAGPVQNPTAQRARNPPATRRTTHKKPARNPQFLALHSPYGSPDDLRRFVDAAHGAGLAVIVDIVLHHGAPDGNALWEYDGGGGAEGGIFHEGGHNGPWGRTLAFWKAEARSSPRAPRPRPRLCA